MLFIGRTKQLEKLFRFCWRGNFINSVGSLNYVIELCVVADFPVMLQCLRRFCKDAYGPGVKQNCWITYLPGFQSLIKEPLQIPCLVRHNASPHYSRWRQACLPLHPEALHPFHVAFAGVIKFMNLQNMVHVISLVHLKFHEPLCHEPLVFEGVARFYICAAELLLPDIHWKSEVSSR